jgi:hypothetical protein
MNGLCLDQSDRVRDTYMRRRQCERPLREGIRRRDASRVAQCLHHVCTPLVIAAASLPEWIAVTSELQDLAREARACQARLRTANVTDADLVRAAILWDRLASLRG